MTWKTVPRKTNKSAIHKEHVVLNVTIFGAHKTPVHNLAIGAGVLTTLGWKVEDPILIEWGDEEHRGQLRLSPTDIVTRETAKLRVNKQQEGRFALGPIPSDAEGRDREPEQLSYRTVAISEGARGKKRLIVQLPEDFYPDS